MNIRKRIILKIVGYCSGIQNLNVKNYFKTTKIFHFKNEYKLLYI